MHLEVDGDKTSGGPQGKRKERQVGRERTYACQSSTTRVVDSWIFKLGNESLANGLNDKAKSMPRSSRVQNEMTRYTWAHISTPFSP